MAEAGTGEKPERILRLVRHYPHPRERVFQAWTDPAQLVKWWGPRGVSIPHYRMDVRVDGHWETTMRNEDGREFFVGGRYLEIVPPARLVFTWAWTTDGVRGHETTVTVELSEQGNGTELRLTQALFDTEEAHRLHGEGWSSSLECLADYLKEAMSDG